MAASLAMILVGGLIAWIGHAPAPRAALPILEAPLAAGPVPRQEPARQAPVVPVRPPKPDAYPVQSPKQQAALPRPDSSPTLPPWRRFAVPVVLRPDRAQIAIVLDDMGLNRPALRRALKLPGPLTFALLPYAEGLPDMARTARAAGHELLLHLPMQASDAGEDGGPVVLETDSGPAETLRRLKWSLARFEGYVGVNNHMGSRFTADPEGMRLVLEELGRRGLLFLDSRTTAATVGERLARDLAVPTASRDVFLDNELEPGAIFARLAEVERIARRKGQVVAIGHPHGATLDALQAWLPTLEAKGFQLVPISGLVRRRQELASRAGGAG